MAFSRSRTRSWAVRSRLRMAGQLGRSRVEQLARLVDAALDPLRSSGAGRARHARRRGAAPRQLCSRSANRPVGDERVARSRAARPASAARPAGLARAPHGCRARRRCWPGPARRAGGRPHRSDPGEGRHGRVRHRRSRASASSREGSKPVCAASCSTIARELQRAQRAGVGGARRRVSGGRRAGHRRSRSEADVPAQGPA